MEIHFYFAMRLDSTTWNIFQFKALKFLFIKKQGKQRFCHGRKCLFLLLFSKKTLKLIYLS